MFLQSMKSHLFLDEIQYVPELLSSLKRFVDESDEKGQFIISGSQNLAIMKNVSESLAGRVGIVNLSVMTPYEAFDQISSENWLQLYLDEPKKLIESNYKIMNFSENLFSTIYRGGFPGILDFPEDLLNDYFNSYIQTYLERDVRVLEEIKDLSIFSQFIRLAATLTSAEINYSQLGRKLGISPNTAHAWLDLLKYTYQWYEVFPYSNNSMKRVTKKRKGYFRDTGLACFLLQITSVKTLLGHGLLGALFESYCVNNIRILSDSLSYKPGIYHWRSEKGAEVDVILEKDDVLYPIEIKCTTNLSSLDAKGIKTFKKNHPNRQIATGLIIYAGKEIFKISEDIYAVPWNILIN